MEKEKQWKSAENVLNNRNASRAYPLDINLLRRIPLTQERNLPPKTTLCALFMLIGGTIFLITGTVIFLSESRKIGDRGFSMILLGSLMFIPGSYASAVLYGAYRGWDGYDYSQIPSYDED